MGKYVYTSLISKYVHPFRPPKGLCNNCLKVYYRFDGIDQCDFCRSIFVCDCELCIAYAYGQMSLDMGLPITDCLNGFTRAVKQ